MSGLPSPTGLSQTTGLSIGQGLGLGYGLAFQGFTSFSPASLFAAGEQGAWYDPSDLTTLFQNAAGTTPVTAVEQPVGCILDKSGRGNHATQSTPTACPVLSARVNLLERTEDFGNAYWSGTATVDPNTDVAPNGTTTADTISSTAFSSKNKTGLLDANVAYKFSVFVKKTTGATTFPGIQLYPGSASPVAASAAINTNTGVVTARSTEPPDAVSSVDAGNYWLVSITKSFSSVSKSFTAAGLFGAVNTDASGTWVATTGSAVFWGADLRVANDGVGLPAYQRVNTSTDYDTAGFPMYLRFDGTDDCLVMPLGISTLNLNIWAGARETGSVNVNSRVMFIGDSTGSTNNLGLFINGGAPASSSVGYRFPENEPVVLGMTTNNTVVVSYQRSSTTLQSARRNGANLTNNTATTTTFTSTTGRVGCLLNSSTNNLFLNGRIYSLIVRGAASTAAQISDTEGWVNSRTRAY